MWSARLDTERRDLPTVVVPINLLTFLHAFEQLGWQELGQSTGAHSIAWIQSSDSWSSDLAAQVLLRFNTQRHHISFEGAAHRYSCEPSQCFKLMATLWG